MNDEAEETARNTNVLETSRKDKFVESAMKGKAEEVMTKNKSSTGNWRGETNSVKASVDDWAHKVLPNTTSLK